MTGAVLHEWRCCVELYLVPRQQCVHSHKDCFFAQKDFPVRKCGLKRKQHLWGDKGDLASVTDVLQYTRDMK